jgi:hypothetical protein
MGRYYTQKEIRLILQHEKQRYKIQLLSTKCVKEGKKLSREGVGQTGLEENSL